MSSGVVDEFEYVVGDPNSEERGSGARANANKPQLDLIPLYQYSLAYGFVAEDYETDRMLKILHTLSKWQQGRITLENALRENRIHAMDLSAAHGALEYGKGKYAAWNWAKGMAWSIPVGCMLRHLRSQLTGEPYDVESGQTHYSHFMANLVMLIHFERCCPDLNDVKHNALSPKWHKEMSSE